MDEEIDKGTKDVLEVEDEDFTAALKEAAAWNDPDEVCQILSHRPGLLRYRKFGKLGTYNKRFDIHGHYS